MVITTSICPYLQTVLVDEKRINTMREEIERLTVVCGVLLVTYSTVGAAIAGVQSLKTTLKNHLLSILQDVPTRCAKLPSISGNLGWSSNVA